MLLDADESQLVLVDYQERLMPAIHEGAAVLANALRLARVAQLLDMPVWGTEQNPSRLGPNDAALRALCHKTLAKMHFSATEEGHGRYFCDQGATALAEAVGLERELARNVVVAPLADACATCRRTCAPGSVCRPRSRSEPSWTMAGPSSKPMWTNETWLG